MSRIDRNNEPMQNVHYKLSKEYEKLSKMSDWLQEKDEAFGDVGETLTLGTEDNLSLLLKSSAIPLAPFAVGVASVVAGLVVVFPLLGGPGISDQEVQFLEQVKAAGDKIFEFSAGSFKTAFYLASVPLGVSLVSVPKKVLRMVRDKIDERNRPVMIDDDNILTMIEDISNGKEDDPSLEFPMKFLKRVDLRGNSDSFNARLLSYFAYYRYCLLEVKNGKKTEEDVREAFDMIVGFLEYSKHKLGVSKEFKNNRFVNMLIDESGYKEEDFHTAVSK